MFGNDGALPFGRGDFAAELGHFFIRLAVILVFIAEAAHQPAAQPADLARVERKPLHLRHFDGDFAEVRHCPGAAAFPAAGRDAAQKPRFVARADLPQFDAAVKGAGKVAHQFAEVDAVLRREEKEHFVPVEGEFAVDDLHREPVTVRLFLRGADRLRTAFEVLFALFAVFLRRDANDGAQRLRHLRCPPPRAAGRRRKRIPAPCPFPR